MQKEHNNSCLCQGVGGRVKRDKSSTVLKHTARHTAEATGSSLPSLWVSKETDHQVKYCENQKWLHERLQVHQRCISVLRYSGGQIISLKCNKIIRKESGETNIKMLSIHMSGDYREFSFLHYLFLKHNYSNNEQILLL